jgi:hypothetical protein
MFGDIGPAIAEADYKPRISRNPEVTLAAAFILMKRDYGGTHEGSCLASSVAASAI